MTQRNHRLFPASALVLTAFLTAFFFLQASMASHSAHGFRVNQVLEHVFQGGSDNEGESIEEKIE